MGLGRLKLMAVSKDGRAAAFTVVPNLQRRLDRVIRGNGP
jgi:hypothetical protein